MTGDELQRQVEEMRQNVSRMERIVYGDPDLGYPGVVNRIEKLSGQVERCNSYLEDLKEAEEERKRSEQEIARKLQEREKYRGTLITGLVIVAATAILNTVVNLLQTFVAS